MKRTLTASLLLSFILLLSSGCATRVDGLYVSDTFNVATLNTETLLAGGVVDTSLNPLTGTTTQYNRSLANSYSALMLSAFQRERKGLRVKPVDLVVQSVGGKAFDQLMQKYAQAGLGADELAKLTATATQGRYLALAKIDSNTTETETTHQPKYEVKSDNGKVTKYPETMTKHHRRTLVVSLHIYDLAKREVAFTGQVTKTRQNSQVYTLNDATRVIAVIKTFQGKDQDATYPTPDAPDVRTLLSDVFAGFAQNLPKG